MDQSLQDKVVLVSGAARGIGASEARLLAARGAKVVPGDVLDEAGRAVAEEIADARGARSAVYVHLDATSAKDWAEAVAVAEVEFGRLDFLINNAGIHGRLGLEDTTEDEWSRVIDADLKSAWLGMKACNPQRSAAAEVAPSLIRHRSMAWWHPARRLRQSIPASLRRR